MVLLTRRDVPKPPVPSPDMDALVPMRRGIGLTLYDLVLLVPPGRSGQQEHRREVLARGVSTLLEDAGFRTVAVSVPGDAEAPPDKELQDRCSDARAVIVLCEQGQPVTGVWLTWMLGYAAARGQRSAVMPIAQRDPWCEIWSLPTALQSLPYIGTARAVGDREQSFWVLPPDEPPESRKALNMDYWLHSW